MKTREFISLGGNESVKVNFDQLQLSHHAKLRLKERFGITDDLKGLRFCKSVLGQSKFFGLTKCEQNKESYMFSDGKREVYIGTDLRTIATVFDSDKKQHIPYFKHDNFLKDKLIKIFEKEIRKCERSQKAKEKRREECGYLNNIEIAQLKYKMYRTKSEVVKEECRLKINELHRNFSRITNEINTLQQNKKEIAKSLATLITGSNKEEKDSGEEGEIAV